MKKYVYENNIDLINKFINSGFKDYLNHDIKYYNEKNNKRNNENKMTKKVMNAIMSDPDLTDKALQQNIQDFYNRGGTVEKNNCIIMNDTKCSIDALFGWKQLFEVYKGDIKEVIKIYKILRSNKRGHLVFPKVSPSINQLRYGTLKDRIDYLLFDIKNFYKSLEENGEDIELKLAKAYKQKDTCKWLKKFKNFEGFINKMKLDYFVQKVDKEYYIIDLNYIYINKTILNKLPEERSVNQMYFQNIVEYLIKYEKDSLEVNFQSLHEDIRYDYL